MKKNFYTTIMLLSIFLSGLCSGCSSKDNEPGSEPLLKDGELTFSINIKSQNLVRATENGDEKYNENKIEKLWLFAAGADGNILVHNTCEVLNSSQGKYKVAITDEQQQQIPGNIETQIYLVANEDFKQNSMPKTLDELKSLVIENTNLNEQRFQSCVMIGNISKKVDMKDPKTKDLGKISLKRVISKIRINNPKIAIDGYELIGTPEAKLLSYRVKGYLNKTENVPNSIKERMSNFSPLNETNQSAHFYSFYSEWTDGSNERPQLLLTLTMKKKGEKNNTAKKYFYKIPIKPKENKLKVNTLYDLSVLIEILGGLDEDTPVDVEGRELSVKPWDEKEEDFGISSPKYLLVEEQNVVMSVVTSYEVAYKSSSPVKAEITSCTYNYVDSDTGLEVKEPVPAYSPQYPKVSISSTKISFNAELQENNVPKHFTIKLTNNDNLMEEIHVVQYPEQYIAYTFGIESSWRKELPDNLNNKSMYHVVILIPPKDGNMILGFPPTEQKTFYKRSYRRKHRYEYEPVVELVTKNDRETAKMVSPSFELASQLGATLPIKYKDIRDNGDYILYDVNKKGKIVLTNALGTCAGYTETRIINGREEILDDWRLPTDAEIALIDRLQNNHKSAVKTIMTGKFYWAANGVAHQMIRGKDGSPEKAYTRCVRDVKNYNF
ncbi:fimbrial tip adhesin FimD [Porphyromonas macacae]|uniref:fimbrial tip adhesin FimD n=1 Tax=Porphyromonas macacae TaxID=28115 RepID=UPI00126A0668|nr:fimbrial protein [Porphyromonas macacae]